MATYTFIWDGGAALTGWLDSDIALITIKPNGEVIVQTIPTDFTQSTKTTKTTIKTKPIDWHYGDTVVLDIREESNDVYLQNLTTGKAVFLFEIGNYPVSVIQDTLILSGAYQSFNFEILDLGSFSFSNKAPMIKTYKVGNYNYMLNNITYNDGSTYLGLVRYDITDRKCHVFHLGRDFLSGFPDYIKETMYISNNMFYVTTTGEIVMLLQAPTYLIPQTSDICFFVFVLTGTQIFYIGMHVTTKNADETFMIVGSQVVFENGDAIRYLGNVGATGDSGNGGATGDSGNGGATGDSGNVDVTGDSGNVDATGDSGNVDATGDSGNVDATGDSGNVDATGDSGNSFDNYGEIIANGDIYWGDRGRVILDEASKLSISDIGSAKPPLIGLIGFANKFKNSRAEVYFYDNKVSSVIYKSLPDMNDTIGIFSYNIYTASLDDNNVTTGGLHLCNYKTIPEWGYDWETTLNRVGFSFFGSGKDVSYIRFLNGFIKPHYNEGWEVKGNNVTYLPSIFNNALYCSNIYEHYTNKWYSGFDFNYSPSFFVLTADFKFYQISQNVTYTYPYIVNLDSPSYYEPINIIDMPSSLKHFGGVFAALNSYDELVYLLFIVDPATGYPCVIDVALGSICETLGQEATFQNPKLISQSQVSFGKYGIDSTIGILHFNEYPLFIVDSDGYVWARGKNDYGQLGLGDRTDRTTFSKLSYQFNNPIKILSYRTCTYFIYANGNIYCAGRNVYGHFNLDIVNSDNPDNPYNPKIVSTPVRSRYSYIDYKQILFSEERITAVNRQGKFTYSGVNFPYKL